MFGLIVISLFAYAMATIIYIGVGIGFYEDCTKEVEVTSKHLRTAEIKRVADFSYNNLAIIMNYLFFIGFFILLIYFTYEDEYNYFTGGKEIGFFNWLLAPKNK